MGAIDLLKFQKDSYRSALYDIEINVSGKLSFHQSYNGKPPACLLCGGEKATRYSTQGINWSGIRDHLIRLAAHYTEYFASDLLVYLDAIERDLENGEVRPEGYFFGFRELGIDSGKWIQNQYDHSKPTGYYRAIWRVLVSIAKNREVEMSLHRVTYAPNAKEAA